MYYYFCYYCPYRLAVIDEELAPDLFDLINSDIFEELNPEGIPGVPGIPGQEAFPAITPRPGLHED